MPRYALCLCVSIALLGAGQETGFRAVVEADWALQEARLGRVPTDAVAVQEALRRCERLVADLGVETGNALARLRRRVDGVDGLGEKRRLALYHDVRWLTREKALGNPLIAHTPVAFLKRRRFICQMLHEYLGYYYDYGDIAGGGVYILERPGHSMAVEDLVRERLPKGNYTTLALSYDARTIYFAFAPRASEKPGYYSEDRRCFHVYAMDADGGNPRPLTEGPNDDFDPCALPDGDLAFMSTRRGGFGRCHNPWEPLPAYTLHRMDTDGGNIRTLSFHETNEWHPSVLNDGSIIYSRWDYVDRSAAHFHGLWVSNPDGTNPRALFGSYTQRINACFQPRAVPGSTRIVFVAGAHHADVGGSLVLLDPARVGLDPESGQDRFDGIEVLTPEVCFPEAPGWPDSYFHSPWPLSEDYYLVSFSFDRLPGMGPHVKKDTETGLYLFDRWGNLELLYREPGLSCMYPVPVAPRGVPPTIPSTFDADLGDEGEFVLADVNRSHFALPDARPIRALRVFQILPKWGGHVANKPRIGHANAESARMLLGTVPVEADGSAYFRAPARKPLAFQAVDAERRAVQGMRSVTYLQPGERRGCVGCHEPVGSPPAAEALIASQREPSRIQAGPDGSHPWSYTRLVQPILNARCVRCHAGEGDDHLPVLTSEPDAEFNASYQGLRPYVRWYEWGGNSIEHIVTRPGRMPADQSPLARIIDDANHAGEVRLTSAERRRIYLWLDGNASFYGTYCEEEQAAQRNGEVIPLAKVQ